MEPDPTMEPNPDDQGQAIGSLPDMLAEDRAAPEAIPAADPDSLIAALTGGRTAFLRAVADRLAQPLSPAAQHALRQDRATRFAEAKADSAITAVVSEDADRPAAAAICAALAARTVARALQHAEGTLEHADCAILLDAWSDAARTLDAAHGAEGLRTLLPVARVLARRVAGQGEPVHGIATVLRHMAGRIAADAALVRALASPAKPHAPERPRRGMPGPPRRIVLHGPVEIAFQTR